MKKILLSILCITLIASAAITTRQDYTELELQIANNFAKKGIIIDYSKNPELYRLNENITRSELMAIALKIKGVKLPDEFVCQGEYSDVVDNNWICRTVELSEQNQLIRSPSSDKPNARPFDSVTRAEALSILLKANGLIYEKNRDRGNYADTVPQWQIDVMEGAVQLKIIPTTQGRGPNTVIKRKEVLGLAHNMKYATGEYKLSTLTPSPATNSAPEENTAAAQKNILSSTITVKQDSLDKLKYTFSVAPKTLEGVIKSVNWYIKKTGDTSTAQSLGTGPNYTYTFTESGKYTIEAKIEDSLGNILTARTLATITITGNGTNTTTTTPPPTTTTTTTTPPAGNTVSGEAAINTPPVIGDKVAIKLNETSLQFTVGDSKAIKEVDTAVKTMKIGDKKNVSISSLTGGKITTAVFVVELVDIQRKNASLALDATLADFKITAPTEVKINAPFDVTITAVNKTGQVLTQYAGAVFIEPMADPINYTFPKFTSGIFKDEPDLWGYQFNISDKGIHTIVQGFTFNKAGDYKIDFFDIDILPEAPDGISKTITIKVTN